jgi:hypothetical protein
MLFIVGDSTILNGTPVCWGGTGYMLQQNSSLNPAGWSNVPGGSNSPVSVAIGAGTQFFRLARQ